MKRFQFRLETLLKIRKREEEQAQIALTAAIKDLSARQMELNQLEMFLQQAFLDFPLGKKPMMVDELWIYRQYIDGLNDKISCQQKLVQEAIERRNEYLKVFEEAAQKRKLVEKLKAKRLQEFQKYRLQEEQKFIDELAGQIFSRKIR